MEKDGEGDTMAAGMIWKGVGLFLGGVALGASSGYYFAKKKYVAIKERQIEELKRMGEIRDEYRRGTNDDETEDADVTEESRENGILSQETRENLKNLRKTSKKEDRVPYSKYYEAKKDGVDPAELESPEEISEVHLEHIDDPPEWIDEEALGDVPAWVESDSLIYYIEDQLLTDEDDNPVQDPKYHVGDILENLNFDEYPHDVIYIWNHGFDTLYEITLMDRMETYEEG